MDPKTYWTKKHKKRLARIKAMKAAKAEAIKDEGVKAEQVDEPEEIKENINAKPDGSDDGKKSVNKENSPKYCKKSKCGSGPNGSNGPNGDEDCEHPLSPLGRQLALLIIAALAFLIAAYWKTFLEQSQGDYFKNNLLGLFIFVVGLTVIATIIIYYLGTFIDDD